MTGLLPHRADPVTGAVLEGARGSGTLARELDQAGELFGAPLDTPWTKRYAFGLLPVGDAFVAWAKTARPWVHPAAGARAVVSWWWRVPLVLLLLAAVLPWAGALRRLRGGGTRPATAAPSAHPDSADPPR